LQFKYVFIYDFVAENGYFIERKQVVLRPKEKGF